MTQIMVMKATHSQKTIHNSCFMVHFLSSGFLYPEIILTPSHSLFFLAAVSVSFCKFSWWFFLNRTICGLDNMMWGVIAIICQVLPFKIYKLWFEMPQSIAFHIHDDYVTNYNRLDVCQLIQAKYMQQGWLTQDSWIIAIYFLFQNWCVLISSEMRLKSNGDNSIWCQNLEYSVGLMYDSCFFFSIQYVDMSYS